LKLDGLPLALATAGAYLEHVTDSFAEYLRLYEASWADLQTTSPTLSSYEDRSLYTTWQVTFDLIRKQNAASAQLLKLWAYFDKQDVWFELIQHARSADDEWIQKLTSDKASFNEAVRLLCEYGLAHPEPSLGQPSRFAGYGVHSCVHSWTMSVLNGKWDEGLARLALTCVASEVPPTDIDKWWLLQQRLLQHVARHRWFIMNGDMDVGGIEWTLDELGNLYANQGKLAEAEAMYSRALQGYEEALGPKLLLSYLPALNTMTNFGDLFSTIGQVDTAKTMYTRALEGYTTIREPSSKLCKQLRDRLETLQAMSLDSKDQGTSVEVRDTM
jgi:tetratricopeptide (TPR) repeat protein